MSIKNTLDKIKETLEAEHRAELRRNLPGGIIEVTSIRDGERIPDEEVDATVNAEIERRSQIHEQAGLPRPRGFVLVPRRGQMTDEEFSDAANALEPTE